MSSSAYRILSLGRNDLLIVLLGLLCAALLPPVSIRRFSYDILAWWAALVIAAPALLLGSALIVVGLVRGITSVAAVGRHLFIIAVAVFLLSATVPLWRSLRLRTSQRAQEYCASLIPLLDAYKQKQGRFPSSIAEVTSAFERQPYLLRGRKFYRSDGHVYSFYCIESPWTRTVSHWWSYRSDTERWDGGD